LWELRGIVGYGLAASFYLPSLPGMPDASIASAVVRAAEGQSLLALAQSVNATAHTATAVSAAPAAGGALYAPLVTNDVDGWRSGVQVQNGAAQTANITLRFLDQQGATAVEVDDTLPANGARSYYLPSLPGLPDGFVGSLVIQGQADAMLSAVVNDVR
jgi:hypothetical protein